MNLSILYKNEADAPQLGEPAVAESDRQMLYDLSVDRAIMTVCMDVAKREKFLDILARPLKTIEAVDYRQQVLGEFVQHPAFFDEMKSLFDKYRALKSRWDMERSQACTIKRLNAGRSDNKQSELYSQCVALQVTARYTKIMLSYIRTIYDLMSGYAVTSEAFRKILTYCGDIVRCEAYSQLEALADRCEHEIAEIEMADAGYHDVLVEFDGDMKLKTCSLTSKSEFKTVAEKKKGGFFGFGRKEEGDVRYEGAVQITTMNFDPIIELSITACLGLDNMLTRVVKNMYMELYHISAELDFYEVALMYCDRMRHKGANLCFPKIHSPDENILYCEGLRDVMLLCESIAPGNVIPNDVSIDGRIEGMLIRGENNSGKTVYLRSVGTALIFAQAGLMVTAKNAEISIRTGIFTHFASAEETGGVAAAGRFEQEVRNVAEIIKNLKPNSLILMNETFQTTSYDEGAEGMYHILNHIRSLGGGFIFVTHLHHLFDLYTADGDDQVCFRRTSSGNEPRYKIIEL